MKFHKRVGLPDKAKSPLFGRQHRGQGEVSSSGLYDPFGPTTLAWDLGQGWGFGYMLGYYTAAVGGPIASSSDSVNQRFGLSYTANGWNLSTNNILGIVAHPLSSHPHGSPCPSLQSKGCNTDLTKISPQPRPSAIGSWARSAIFQPI